MEETLNYNEVFAFMREFKVDYINRFNEMIVDHPTNTYVSINGCKNIEDVKTRVVYALCRPIGKGLKSSDGTRIQHKFNEYFGTNLKKSDFRIMYDQLCYESKIDEFKDFIKRGFPMNELRLTEGDE